MRITREILLRIVRETVAQRTRADRSLLAIYLCGSLLEEEFLLGGTTDIDLVFIHTDLLTNPREVVRLTDDVHLDISHQMHRDYRQARKLRVHPWIGPTLYKCQILHDPQHFMDFTQASVRGQFERSDYVLERARQQAEHARQMWVSFHEEQPEPGPIEIARYLKALEHAANSVASLSGSPLTERRFLLRFANRAEAVRKPGLMSGLLGLLGAPNVNAETLKGWLPNWQAAYESAHENEPNSRLHPDRKAYFRKAFDWMLASPQPQAVLWPLLRTWTLAIQDLPAGSPELTDWQRALTQLGLLGEPFPDRIAAMDAYLDLVEETLEIWAHENGVDVI